MLLAAGVGRTPGPGAQRLLRGDRLGRVERRAGPGAPVHHAVDAEQRRPGHHRPVRAARQHHARLQQGTLPVQPGVPVRADRGEHAVAEFGGEAALGHGDHAELRGPGDLPGLDHGEVLNAVPWIGPRVLGEGLGVGVEDQVDGPVADRVRGDLPAGAVRGDDGGPQRLRVGLQVAAA